MTDAARGAVGFLTRLPVGRDAAAWAAFRQTPAAGPLAAYLIGALLVLPLLPGLPPATAAVAFVAWLYLLTGINHLDGMADLGDAAVVHGDADDRRSAMKDTTVGVGAVLAVGIALAGVAAAGFSLAVVPMAALGIVIAAEVGAKLGRATVACLGSPAHEGLGAEVITPVGRRELTMAVLVALPAIALTGRHPAAGVAVLGGLATAIMVLAWSTSRLDGASGDVLGATNELSRLVGLHLGVIAWTLW